MALVRSAARALADLGFAAADGDEDPVAVGRRGRRRGRPPGPPRALRLAISVSVLARPNRTRAARSSRRR